MKIDFAHFSSHKRFDFGISKNYHSTTFLGTPYSQIVQAAFEEDAFYTPTPFLLVKQNCDI